MDWRLTYDDGPASHEWHSGLSDKPLAALDALLALPDCGEVFFVAAHMPRSVRSLPECEAILIDGCLRIVAAGRTVALHGYNHGVYIRGVDPAVVSADIRRLADLLIAADVPFLNDWRPPYNRLPLTTDGGRFVPDGLRLRLADVTVCDWRRDGPDWQWFDRCCYSIHRQFAVADASGRIGVEVCLHVTDWTARQAHGLLSAVRRRAGST